MPYSPTCPICGALLGPAAHAGPMRHAEWHYRTNTLAGSSTDELLAQVREQCQLAELVKPDERPTERFPAIGDTVRRRPPVPKVTELSGAELVEALMAELEHERRGGDS